VRRALGLFGVRLAALLACALSAALLLDYVSSVPTFCGADSGCALVRHSGYGYLTLWQLAVPVPAIGLLGFALLLAATLTRGLQRWVPLIAGGGGAVGLSLLAVQGLKIGHFCWLCVTVDGLSLLAAACGLLLGRGAAEAREDIVLRRGAWPALASLALLAPLGWSKLRPADAVPPGVQQLYLPGKINVVEFADYECPYCRALHPQLSAIIASYPGKVHFTRLNLPLKSHPFARGAALSQVCAREQDKGDALANRLFSADDLRPEATRALAREIGLDLDLYDRCLSSGRAERVVDSESKILLDAGLQGLPTTYVGSKTIIGVQPEEVFRDAFERAERGDGDANTYGVSATSYWLCLLTLAAAICWVGRARHATL
jgi:predicted DsbA family dithiol-disulfide isomerase